MSKVKLNNKYISVIIINGLVFIFSILMLVLSKAAGFSETTNLIISGTVIIAISAFLFLSSRKVWHKAISEIIEKENFLCNYAVKPDIIRDFNKYFFDLNKENRAINFFLSMLGILIVVVALLFLGIDYLLIAEIAIVLILFVLFIFNQMKKRMEFTAGDNVTVHMSTDNVVLDGKLTVWNSQLEKITDVIFRKINEQTHYVTVYYNSYSAAENIVINTEYLNYASGYSEDIIIVEKKISIPVPASEKEKVQAVVDEMLKLKIKRR